MLIGKNCLIDNQSESGIKKAHEPNKPDKSSNSSYFSIVGNYSNKLV